MNKEFPNLGQRTVIDQGLVIHNFYKNIEKTQAPNTKTSPVFEGNIKFMILVEANMFPIITNPVQFKLSSKLKKNTEEAKKNAFSFFD